MIGWSAQGYFPTYLGSFYYISLWFYWTRDVCNFTQYCIIILTCNITAFQWFHCSCTRSKTQFFLFPGTIWVLCWDQTILFGRDVTASLKTCIKTTKLFSPFLKFLTSLGKQGKAVLISRKRNKYGLYKQVAASQQTEKCN